MTEQSSTHKSDDKWAGSQITKSKICSAIQSSSINSLNTALL